MFFQAKHIEQNNYKKLNKLIKKELLCTVEHTWGEVRQSFVLIYGNVRMCSLGPWEAHCSEAHEDNLFSVVTAHAIMTS